MLWSRSDDAHACLSLRQTLTLLRKSLAHAECSCVIGHGGTLHLDPRHVDVDTVAFDALCADHSGEALERAAALHRGDFLEDFALNEEPFEDWLRIERTNAQAQLLDALTTLLDGHLATGNAEQGVAVARRLLAVDSSCEKAHRALMRLYADAGDRVLALKQYQSCCKILGEELELEPELETRRLHEEIRQENREGYRPAHTWPLRLPPRPDKPTIAVLPFSSLHPDETLVHLGDDIANDIITELSRFRSMLVTSRHSSFAYRDKPAGARYIGQELGADYLVEGRLGRIGEQVRVSVALVDVRTCHQFWADRFDWAMVDLVATRDQLVRTIVSTIDRRVDVASKLRAAATSESARRSYDLYLMAAAAQDRNTKESYQYAGRCLSRAIALDPGLGQAHHHLSLVRFFSWMELWVADRDEVFEAALAAAREAVARDDSDSMAHAHLGMLYIYRRQFDEAARRFAEAVRLNPSDSRVRGLFGLFLTSIGRAEEALEQFEEAERLNPLLPSWLTRLKGMAYFSVGRYADAIPALSASAAPISQEFGWLAASCAHAGRLDEARQHLDAFLNMAARDMAVTPEPTVDAWRSCWRPIEYQHRRDFDRLFDGLRRAGLPA